MKNYVTLTVCAVLALTAAGQALGNAYNDAIMGEASLITYHNFNNDTGALGSAIDDLKDVSEGSFLTAQVVTATGNVAANAGQFLDFSVNDGVVEIGTLGNYGSAMNGVNGGATLEFWVKGVGDDVYNSDIMGLTWSGSDWRANTHQVRLRLDYDYSPAAIRQDYVRFYQAFEGNASNPYTGAQARNGGSEEALYDVASSAGLTDGDWAYVAIVTNPASDVLKMYMAKPGSKTVEEYSAQMDYDWTYSTQDFAYDWILGGTRPTDGGTWFNGGLDEIATYDAPLSLATMQAHVDAMYVPEPSIFAMLLGLGLVLFTSRRR